MADELSIQQPSKAPYVLGGAAIGAIGAGATAHYTTKPKYNSHEDIVKAADDQFTSSVKEVSSDESFVQKAQDARKKLIEAGEKWENDKKAYVEANKGGVAPTELPEGHELLNKKSELEKQIATLESQSKTTTITKTKDNVLGDLRENAKKLTK